MHLSGIISFEYDEKPIARDTAMLIQLDNKIAPKTLSIETWAEKTNVVTRVEAEKTGSFFATVDDLIFSEKLIANIIEMEV